ncbi:DUF7577 domain-containing protein [Halopelagius longus]|uniref:DUF7577 domain-containing protein n=1 Tax=Halopelagius longus TaxID=1236180 RepID=A0A1H0XT99_9EURY|nr:hypothetical protein [Halopelagius longus]RDI72079.1 hypothetical protein DWB78_10300 [Halopelagius longus]SDQ06122.1 hypothetical protein SAMN05216278_0168 [Halopelagius longus]
MDAWGWIVVYAIGLTVLQLVVYRYLLDGDEGVQGGFGGDGDDAESHARTAPRGRDAVGVSRLQATEAWDRESGPSDARVCPRCGVENEPDRTFDRCWNCAGRLA